MVSLDNWFSNPAPPIVAIETVTRPAITPGLMGTDPIETVPQSKPMIDLAAYWTPFRVLFNRSKATLTGV